MFSNFSGKPAAFHLQGRRAELIEHHDSGAKCNYKGLGSEHAHLFSPSKDEEVPL
jgi:hypothetical protein